MLKTPFSIANAFVLTPVLLAALSRHPERNTMAMTEH
jgi:hypothetical protein